jgi:hypothetical protein
MGRLFALAALLFQIGCGDDRVVCGPPAQHSCVWPQTGDCSSRRAAFEACLPQPQACEGAVRRAAHQRVGRDHPGRRQHYYSDAKAFRILFAPGGTRVKITDSGPIPNCKDLPAVYEYERNEALCAGDIAMGAVFAGARPPTISPGNWKCKTTDGNSHAVLCRW